MPSLVCSHFLSSVLKQLQTYREKQFLCDVRLVTDSQSEFFAHRLILSASSPFFQELFQSDAQDVSTVHLRNCSGECVQVVLQFLYSGELQLRNCDPAKLLNLAKACKIASLQYLLAAYDVQPDGPKLKVRKLELDLENFIHRTDRVDGKRTEIKRGSEFLKKFCLVHSLIGCDCFGSDTNPSSEVFSPSINQLVAQNKSADYFETSPLQALPAVNCNGKLVKNTGVTTNSPQPSNTLADANGFALDDVDIGSSLQLPVDEKEGWCRNKKYIKKTPTGYQCAVCKKTYGRYNSVSYHVTIYHRNPPIQCDQHGCTFSTREARYIHFHKYYRHGLALPTNIDLHSRRCPFCKHVAKSPAMLEKHINRHLPNGSKTGGSYQCELCDKLLPSKHALIQHGLLHVGEKSHPCDKCSYKGRTGSNLQQHKMFKHGGDLWRKNHQCDRCSYSSPSQFNIVSHKRRLHSDFDSDLKMGEEEFHSDDPCSDGTGSLVDEDEPLFIRSLLTVVPPPPPPSYCSDSDFHNAKSTVSSTTGFLTAAADFPPSSVVDYGLV